jgi:hypothetical protein
VSPLGALWFASLFGAALFLAAGYFAAVVRRQAFAGGLPDERLVPGATFETTGEDRLARALEERDAARGEIAAARRETATFREAAISFEQRLIAADASTRGGEETKRLLGKANDDAERWREEARTLGAKVSELTRRLDEASRDPRKPRAEGAAAADDERRELTVRVGVLEGRLREAEHLREENASLRASLRDRALLEEKLRVAERQLTAPGEAPKPIAVSPKGPAVDGSRREKLRRILAALGAHGGVRAALFADDLGFPVESVGEHTDSLAALSGVLAGAAVKARQLLPIGPAARIAMSDDHDLTVTVRRHPTDWGPLALVTLSQGAAPEVDPRSASSRPPPSAPPSLPPRPRAGAAPAPRTEKPKSDPT